LSLPDPSARCGDAPLPEPFAAALAREAARLGPVARSVRWYAEIGSTNDVAAAQAEQGAAEGLVVLAERQTAGRGRHGRTWESPRGGGLYFSVLLRPGPAAVPLLTIAAGVAIADGIRDATGFLAVLKWPNDVCARPTGADRAGRKLAGILAEAGQSAGSSHAILGVGINVRAAEYPPPVSARATSLEVELGRPVDAGELLARCLVALRARYDGLRAGRAAELLQAWRAYAQPLMEHPVEWNGRDGVERGVVQGIDDSGALVVRTAAGVSHVTSGEVRWL
jgi:BirA family biotin operon repressor/biotin-[acetyl-CoA-carboxylase] ligase